VAEDLLEKMEREEETNASEKASSGKLAGKFSFLKKLLFFRGLTGKKKWIAIIVMGVFLLLAGVGGWLMFFSGSADEGAPLPEEELLQEPGEKKEEIVFEDIVVMEPFERIPLKKESTMKFISLGISLELVDHRYRKQVYTVQDRLRKIVEAQVRRGGWLELRNPEGKIKLKYEMLSQMNKIFPKVTIRNIYFTNFIMQ